MADRQARILLFGPASGPDNVPLKALPARQAATAARPRASGFLPLSTITIFSLDFASSRNLLAPCQLASSARKVGKHSTAWSMQATSRWKGFSPFLAAMVATATCGWFLLLLAILHIRLYTAVASHNPLIPHGKQANRWQGNVPLESLPAHICPSLSVRPRTADSRLPVTMSTFSHCGIVPFDVAYF